MAWIFDPRDFAGRNGIIAMVIANGGWAAWSHVSFYHMLVATIEWRRRMGWFVFSEEIEVPEEAAENAELPAAPAGPDPVE